jgi:hypothetical protein
LALLLCGASMSAAQQPGHPPGGRPGGLAAPPAKPKAPPEKSKLEEMLAEALRNNPDIRVAAARLAEAEAKLNRTRVHATQQVVTLYQSIVSQRALVEVAQKKNDRLMELHKQAAVDARTLDEASANLTVAKAKLAELEAQMPGLLGKTPHAEESVDPNRTSTRLMLELMGRQPDTLEKELRRVDLLPLVVHPTKTTGPMAERLRKALQTPIKADYTSVPLGDILTDLQNKAPGLTLLNTSGVAFGSPWTFHFKDALPVSAILEALGDLTDSAFYVRDYGVLMSNPKSAPPGAITIQEFLRQKPADEPDRNSGGGKNPPPQSVEGRVKSVDDKGFMTISIGSDAGLVKGHTLELFRLNPSSPSQSRYLGTIRIFEVRAKESAAQVVGRHIDTPEVGDNVASRIPGK